MDKEKYIVDQLKQHAEPLLMEDLWSDIQPHIPKQKKKRVLWLWWGMAGVLSVALVFYWISAEEVNPPAQETATSLNTTANVESVEEESIIATTKTVELQEIVPSQNTSSGLLTPSRQENVSNITILDTPKPATSFAKGSVSTSANQSTNVFQSTTSKIISMAEEKQMPTSARKTVLNEYLGATTLLAKLEQELVAPTRVFGKEVPQLTLPISEPSRFPAFFISSGLSLGTNFADFGANTSEGSTIADRRSASEVAYYSTAADLNIGYHINRKFGIYSGLRFINVGTVSSFQTIFETAGENPSLIGIRTGKDGTEEFVYSNETETVQRTTTEKRYNTIQSFTIPLGLQYQLLATKRFNLDVRLFGNYHFSNSYAGFISNSSGEPSYNLAQDQEQLYKNNSVYSHGIGLRINTPLASRWNVFFGVDTERTTSYTADAYGISHSLTNIYLTSGISTNF